MDRGNFNFGQIFCCSAADCIGVVGERIVLQTVSPFLLRAALADDLSDFYRVFGVIRIGDVQPSVDNLGFQDSAPRISFFTLIALFSVCTVDTVFAVNSIFSVLARLSLCAVFSVDTVIPVLARLSRRTILAVNSVFSVLARLSLFALRTCRSCR